MMLFKPGHLFVKMICICRSRLHGVGLFSKKKFRMGECILKFDKNCGGKTVAMDDYFGRYINHSDNPTCKVDGYMLSARRHLKAGEEFTIDYRTINVPTCNSWNETN